jgi:hypothetical protein
MYQEAPPFVKYVGVTAAAVSAARAAAKASAAALRGAATAAAVENEAGSFSERAKELSAKDSASEPPRNNWHISQASTIGVFTYVHALQLHSSDDDEGDGDGKAESSAKVGFLTGKKLSSDVGNSLRFELDIELANANARRVRMR